MADKLVRVFDEQTGGYIDVRMPEADAAKLVNGYPIERVGAGEIQKLTKPVKKGKYDDWRTQFERVPVQYGNFSRRERKVIHIAMIGSVPRLGQIESYYRIADGERGAGRFFVLRRWNDLDEETKEERLLQQAYYLRYRELPEPIRKHLESGATTTFYADQGGLYGAIEVDVEPPSEPDDGTLDPNPETFERESREGQ